MKINHDYIMLIHNRLFVLIVLAVVINAINIKQAFPMEDEQDIEDRFEGIEDRFERLHNLLDLEVHRANDAIALAHNASTTANRAVERSDEFFNRVDGFQYRLDAISEGIEEAQHVKTKNQRERDLKDKMKIRRAVIDEKHRRGIYTQAEKIRAKASIDTEISKWDKIKEIMSDSKPVVNIVLAATAIALSVYTIKYGIPALMNHVRRPHVISETSKRGWFDFDDAQETNEIDDLIFNPTLKKQLFDLAVRIKSARMFSENLPNILFYGPPGTGKTAFVRTLAHYSGLDYALTSGSEFAKITNLNTANNELRNLLDWANNTENGLIVFIDEAQSLFANTKLPTTPKKTQDFINTFLSLIPDKSQKNVMFVFATNDPFMLDDAMTNRIGISIEMPLPEAPEREKILDLYLKKFAHENEEAIVAINPEVTQTLPSYAENLKGLSPRAIKFVAEEMIVAARRQMPHQLTNTIAQKVLAEAKQNLEETKNWERAREQWLKTHTHAGH